MKKLIVATLAGSMVLSGCATTGTTGTAGQPSGINKGVLGAIGGALGGAAISKATGGDKTGRDAAIGAALGSAVGLYMERQEAKLKQQTAGTGIEVSRDPRTNDIRLVMPESITFDVGQSQIRPAFYGTLNQVASTLNEYGETTVTVRGYASSEGDYQFNQRLSQARADSVSSYLAQSGVSRTRIQSVGMGIQNPVASNATPEGRAQNRRVELTINAPQTMR